MIGIYRITNLLNGKSYIGKSIDIERRFAEHKTPKANGNDLLHGDIQLYGVDNFRFEVIEKCKLSEISKKELYYIKKEQPFYNKIGKKIPQTTKLKISKSCKKWWEQLPQQTKDKIIKENLTGPKKDHKVSKKTRNLISKKISEKQKQKVRCLETGVIYNSIGEFEKSVNACTGTCAAYWKGKIKSVKGYHVEKV